MLMNYVNNEDSNVEINSFMIINMQNWNAL